MESATWWHHSQPTTYCQDASGSWECDVIMAPAWIQMQLPPDRQEEKTATKTSSLTTYTAHSRASDTNIYIYIYIYIYIH